MYAFPWCYRWNDAEWNNVIQGPPACRDSGIQNQFSWVDCGSHEFAEKLSRSCAHLEVWLGLEDAFKLIHVVVGRPQFLTMSALSWCCIQPGSWLLQEWVLREQENEYESMWVYKIEATMSFKIKVQVWHIMSATFYCLHRPTLV